MKQLTHWENELLKCSNNPRPINSNLKFTLIFPATEQVPTPNRGFLIFTPQEGVTYILSVARNAGWDVEMIDLRPNTLSLDEAAKMAAARGGIVAMPTFVDSYIQNEYILKKVKELNPSVTTILGGALISSLPEPIIKTVELDYAILHEGELSMLELLEHIAAKKDKKSAKMIEGIAIRFSATEIFKTPARPQITNLDILPLPRLELYPSVKENPNMPEMGITTSRGCYGRCTFCFLNMKELKFKSPERTEQELIHLIEKHNVKYFYINDLTFTADLKRAEKISSIFGKYKLTWSCSTRVERIESKLLKHMKDNGCREIWYGVESLDQDILDRCNKRQNIGQIHEAIKETQAAGITVMSNLIVGLPGETDESLQKMFDFVENGDLVPASIKYLTPFPGTKIYDMAVEKGLIPDPIEYLKTLCYRKVNSIDDAIINLTELPEAKIRDAFTKIMAIRDARMKQLPNTIC